jgi:hypothetical protein
LNAARAENEQNIIVGKGASAGTVFVKIVVEEKAFLFAAERIARPRGRSLMRCSEEQARAEGNDVDD